MIAKASLQLLMNNKHYFFPQESELELPKKDYMCYCSSPSNINVSMRSSYRKKMMRQLEAKEISVMQVFNILL
jgi:hypothetical protein